MRSASRDTPRASTVLRAAAVSLAVALGAADSASAATRHYMSTSTADVSLNSSPWSKLNDVEGPCKGIGPMRRDGNARKLYSSFRCTMTRLVDGVREPRGVVVVITRGPEYVRVRRVESGDLTPHVPIEGIPSKARPRMRSLEAGYALGRSTWAQDKELFGALCFGVGRFKDRQSGYHFGSFVCRVRIIGAEPAIVLARARSDRAVRVVRTLA